MTSSKRVQYRGQVQGVGFRYAARQLAEDFPVAGYVRNLPNGEVELVAEGPAEEVDRFLEAIDRRMAGYITGRTVNVQEPGGFQGFGIRH
jgi:acylphosphatase